MEHDNQSQQQWATLPWIPLLEAFSLLDRPSDLARASLVCRAWHAAATDNHIWRRICLRDWRIRSNDSTSSDDTEDRTLYKTRYQEMFNLHGPYRSLYAQTSDMWDAYRAWLTAHAPTITLLPPASPREVKELEQVFGEEAKLPHELECSLRICNGQESSKSGLLGSYSFYDCHVEMRLLGTREMKFLSESAAKTARTNPEFPQWVAKSCVIARAMGKLVFMLMSDLDGHGTRGNVVVASEDFEHTFLLASDYLTYLSNHLASLLAGAYNVSDQGKIDLFPRPPARGVGVATTRGITVESAPLFVPERSRLTSFPPSYFFAYKIRMSMRSDQHQDSDDHDDRTSRLVSRHWLITGGDGRSEEVSGPGVIGLYPVMHPGATFEYASCCPLTTPRGTMKGSFTMEYTDSGEQFEVEVPEFEFFLPPGCRPGAD